MKRAKRNPARLPLNPSARWALRDPLPSIADGRVFRRWDDVRAFKKYWARVCELAKIQQGLGVDYEVRQALLGHRMPGMTAAYSHGGPAWDEKLREAVNQLHQAFRMADGLADERPAAKAVGAKYLKVVSRLGLEPRALALKAPALLKKIN